MRMFVLLPLFVAACANAPEVLHREVAPPPVETEHTDNFPSLETLNDSGEQHLVGEFLQAATMGDTSAARRTLTEFAILEAEAIHGSLEAWLAAIAGTEMAYGVLYTRDGALGRFLTATTGHTQIAFFIVDHGVAMRIDNVLSTSPVVPGESVALHGSRANVLRAFWGYFGALTGVAPEFLPDRAAEAPGLSRRLRLAAWRSSVAPSLRARLVESGPEVARNSVPAFLDAMESLLGDYHMPQVRQADLQAGTAVVIFTPTEVSRETRNRAAFTLVYKAGWYHGMQVLVSEEVYRGKAA